MKKPGEFKAQKARHKARQALYDALVEMREQGSSTCTYRGKKYRLENPDQGTMRDRILGLVKFGRAIELCWLADKDGLRAYPYSERDGRVIQWEEVLALAYEET
jgi:hypothetical protein